LVRLKVDVIVVPAPQNAAAARQATQTIPIVMASAGDPLESGLVDSLARPGGNVTGTAGLVGPEIVGKRLELLKEAVPRISRVALLWNPANSSSASYLGATKTAARGRWGYSSRYWRRRGPEELDGAFAKMTRERADALLVIPDGMFLLHRTRIADLARLPTMFGGRDTWMQVA
jgi:putative tryptophan/tyrosine transport system substrate-binding protein